MAVKMDTHIHTSFSTDSETDMQEQILTSYKKGLEGICITDHMAYSYTAKDCTTLCLYRCGVWYAAYY